MLVCEILLRRGMMLFSRLLRAFVLPNSDPSSGLPREARLAALRPADAGEAEEETKDERPAEPFRHDNARRLETMAKKKAARKAVEPEPVSEVPIDQTRGRIVRR